MADWFHATYERIDAMDMDGFLAGLAPDIELVVGNHPPLRGKAAVREGIGQFWASIDGLKHHIVNVVEQGSLTALETRIEYRRKDGRTVTIPCVTMLERAGDRIRGLRIYFDIAPVYA